MKRLFKDMSVYGLGGIIGKTIQFLLLPVYTRVLAPGDYGVLELIYMVAAVMGIVYGFMIGSGFIRSYYDNSDEQYRATILGSAFWFTLISTGLLLIACVVLAAPIASAIFKFDNGAYFFRLICISTALMAHGRIFYNLLMVREKARRYVMVNIITLITTLILTIYFVVVLGWGVEGVLIAQATAYAVELVILVAMLMRPAMLRISFSAVREMLAYSIPLIPLQVAAFILTLSDRLFLQEFRTIEEVGLYSLGYKFAALLPLLTVEPLKAFGPYVFKLINDEDRCKQTIADMSRYYLAVSLMLTLIIAMFSREVIMVMSDDAYYPAYRVVFILGMSYVFYGFFNVICFAVHIVKKNWIISALWMFAAMLNILLNLLLIPKYGILGAAVATVISYFAVAIGNLIVVQKVYPIRFEYARLGAILVIITLIYLLSTLVHGGLYQSLALKSLIVIVACVAVRFSGYLRREECEALSAFIRGRFTRAA